MMYGLFELYQCTNDDSNGYRDGWRGASVVICRSPVEFFLESRRCKQPPSHRRLAINALPLRSDALQAEAIAKA